MSNPDRECAEILEEFCDRIILLNDEVRTYLENISRQKKMNRRKLKPMMKKEKEADSEGWTRIQFKNYDALALFLNDKNLDKSVRMHYNAYFLYAFTLFEKFLLDVVEKSLKESKPVQNRYINLFEKFAIDTHAKTKDRRFVSMLTKRKLMLENYKQLPNILNVALEIFALETGDETFKRHFCLYFEARQRRNLLTHRGNKFDKDYLDTMKEFLGKNDIDATKFFGKVIFEDAEKKINFSEIINKAPADAHPRYFANAMITINYLANVIHMSAFKKQKKFYIENASLSISACHNVLVYAYDKNWVIFAIVVDNIWEYFSKYIIKSDVVEWHLFERVNFCLQRYFLANSLNREIKKRKLKDAEKVKKPDLEKLLAKCDPQDEDHRQLALAHFRKDKESLLKCCKRIESITAKEFRDWLIFRTWQKDPDLIKHFDL